MINLIINRAWRGVKQKSWKISSFFRVEESGTRRRVWIEKVPPGCAYSLEVGREEQVRMS